MRLRFVGLTTLGLVTQLGLGCKPLAPAEEKAKDDGKEAALESECDPESNCREDETGDALPDQGGLGLAAFCSFEMKAGRDQGCFTCTPRDLPNTKCVTVPKEFDPATSCLHDLDRLTCKLGSKEFAFEFDERSPDEDLYERMPLLVFGAKALLLKHLESDPDLRAFVFKLLDAIEEHRLAIFTGANTDAIIEDAKPLMMAANPNLTEADIKSIKAAIQKAAAAFAAKRAAGKVTYADGFKILEDAYKALPASLFGNVLEGHKLDEFLAKLKADGDILAELTKLVGGDDAFGDIVAELGSLGQGASSEE